MKVKNVFVRIFEERGLFWLVVYLFRQYFLSSTTNKKHRLEIITFEPVSDSDRSFPLQSEEDQ